MRRQRSSAIALVASALKVAINQLTRAFAAAVASAAAANGMLTMSKAA
jgi:hypothetical protein